MRSLSFVMLTLMALWIATHVGQAQSSPAEDHAGEARDRIQVVLAADGAPAPGGIAHLTFSATPQVATPDLVIEWFLPAGVTLQGQMVETLGGQSAGQTTQTARDLKFAAPGTYKVGVTASFHPSPSMTFSATGVLFFVIDPRGSYVTDQDPDAHRPVTRGMPEQVSISATPSGLAPEEEGCFTVTGHLTRTDRPVKPNGFETSITVPVVNALVDIREEDLVFDDSYGTILTDSQGNFSKSFCDDDGWLDDTLEIYYRLNSERHNDGEVVYVEDSSYIDEKYEYNSAVTESTGGTINSNLHLDSDWSGIFNIIDAISMARQFWIINGASYDENVEIHWESGYGDDGSYFNPYFNEITVADDPSDPDQWDDSVLMHEWGHSADDYYSCDDNPGGDHFINVPVGDDELSWGEGYPDYYQSAVRKANGYAYASYYLDINGMENGGIDVDLETYDVDQPDVINTFNELAIAAALWDFNDAVDDGQDTVNYGHVVVQDVYISEEFTDVAYGFFDDTCNFDTYMRGWIDAGYARDAETAAVVMQNVGYTLPASTLYAASNTDAPQQVNTAYDAVDIYRWWNQLTYVADNSASMSGDKYNAMKVLFAEAVNDLGNNPLGTEFTLEQFNNTSTTNQITFAGQFFPENLIDPINALSPIANPDAACEVYALRALAQAVDNKEKGDVWLFTDGDTYQTPSVEAMRQVLTDKQLRASIALMGLCSLQATTPTGLTTGPLTLESLQALSPEAQQTLMSARLMRGQARTALGVTADDVPGGLVPYLLTALNSGGQFLYVSDAQVTDAADILRAQITNSAGAGRWSDYVSDQATYQYDTLASFEYNWVDASTGVDNSNPDTDSYLTLSLPASFSFYSTPYSSVNVFENGYVTFGNHFTNVNANTTLPTVAEPNNSLYLFWDDIQPNYFIPLGQETPDGGNVTGRIYTKQEGDWFVIEYYDYLSYTPSAVSNTFEMLLNLTTGEIRYQYHLVPDGAPSATLGLENGNGSQGIQVGYNDANGASDEMGYKFTPAPAQPTKTYDVLVDSSMDAVGFLLTGYSGTFEPLLVTKPNGTPVSCADSGVLCLDLDLVQYVQVNTNGVTGTWHATVDAGSSGQGTFAFSSFASSPIAVESGFDHTLSVGGHPIQIRLPNPTGITQVNGHFLTGGGNPFGGSFPFFDDGNHDDGQAGDGLFGTNPFTPPGTGNAFLRVSGLLDGEAFERVDPSPYTFSLLEVTSLGPRDNFGGATFLPFEVTNFDSADHCYWVTYDAPEGWYLKFAFLPLVCVNAGQTATINFETYMAPGTTNDLPSGTTGVVSLSLTEWEKGEISDADSSQITRRRTPASIIVYSPTDALRPDGDTVELEILVLDAENVPVADGTVVSLQATLGDIIAEGTTSGGILRATYTTGPNLGTGTVTAMVVSNSLTDSIEIQIAAPEPAQISLSLSSNFVKPDGVSQVTLTATVTDKWGDPVPGQDVHIGVEGDAQLGTIEGDEVAVGVTDANGQFSVVYTSGETLGVAGVRAELYFDQGAGPEVVAFDRKEIQLGLAIYLPLVKK
jgi:hypothetical protein